MPSFVSSCLLLLLASASAVATSMDMPDDPVNGEMVMSTAYEFRMKYGQRLRFASQETLDTFLKDPTSALGDAKLVDAGADDSPSTSALCPICGMEAASKGGPQVLMKHGDQSIHTCSLFHAREVHDNILNFRDSSTDNAAAGAGADMSSSEDEQAFCTGPGTTMLNGFSLFQGGAMRGGQPCILLWFPGWILNTRWRYVLGCLLVTLCGMMNEYLLRVRRILRRESNFKRSQLQNGSSAAEVTKLLGSNSTAAALTTPSTARIPTWFRTLSPESQHLVHCALHGLTIFIAYMLMLVSMTYDGVLFLCCIAGYVLGYFIFGERREAVPETDSLRGYPSA
ncbi:hypothetical protein ATCC90586_001492 [Pythium insidiosum]|nr:hypothetical protein ATCC90586_001492 [Pythium insidiosum]